MNLIQNNQKKSNVMLNFLLLDFREKMDEIAPVWEKPYAPRRRNQPVSVEGKFNQAHPKK
jgi:hypothetical protein